MNTAPTDAPDQDRFAHWLLGSIEFNSVVLHAGRYCGPWRASTAGVAQASFHLLLSGQCYLHLPGQAPVLLRARDGVFLLRDVDHYLSPYADPAARIGATAMQPMDADGEGTGMACGFFQFRGALSALVLDSFPDYLISRADDPALAGGAALFELMLAETGGDPERPSPLIGRLTELLFFYVLRHAARQAPIGAGLLALARRGEFTHLLDALLRDPAADWTIDSMARASRMSRATFYKHFSEACGMPPAQLLLLLRMTIAAQRLKAGDSVERAAFHVGYQSAAAFTRAFQRSTGASPGAYRRQAPERRARLQTFEQEKATSRHGAPGPAAQ